jgi:hypothetical protein
MARSSGVLVTGDKEIDRLLKMLPLKLQKKLSRQATRKAAKDIVLPNSRAAVPVSTGKLAASLSVRAAKATKGKFGHKVETKPGVYSGESGSQFPGVFLEYGTKERFHKPRKVIDSTQDDGERETGRKSVGRIPRGDFGFMRTAIYDHKEQIKGLYLQAMREFVREAAAK